MPVLVQWLTAEDCLPPHRVVRPEQVDDLATTMHAHGWDCTKPMLVGYPWGARVQLLSGSHRHAAAARARIKMPVAIVPEAVVRAAYGDVVRWAAIMGLGG